MASWRRWNISITETHWNAIATKKARSSEHIWAIQKEIVILEKLQRQVCTFCPYIISKTHDSFSYFRIPWKHFDSVWKQANRAVRNHLAIQLLACWLWLDQHGVIHWELMRPTKNVLVDNKNYIYIIDFERWKIQPWWSIKNLKHIAQRLHWLWVISIEEIQSLWKLKSPKAVYQRLFKHIIMYFNNKENNAIYKTNDSQKHILIKILVWSTCIVSIDIFSKTFIYTHWLLNHRDIITPILNPWISRSVALPLELILILSVLVLVWLTRLINIRNIYERHAYICILWWWIWNFIDRRMLGWVRDFIDLWWRPVFNLADVAITVWVIIFILWNIRNSTHTANKKPM